MATITEFGAVATTYDDYKSDLESRFIDAFGPDLDLDTETPQGQIIGIMSYVLSQLDEAVVALVNSQSVNYAVGSQLDDVTSLVHVQREADEPDTTYRSRYSQLVSANATGFLDSISSRLLMVDEVDKVEVLENSTNAAVTISGVSVNARSIMPVVYSESGSLGSTANTDVISAIANAKPPGTPTQGSVSGSYSPVGRSWTTSISYQVASEIPMSVTLTITPRGGFPTDGVNQIQSAVLARFSELGIGDEITQATLTGAIYSDLPAQSIEITSLTVSRNAGTGSPTATEIQTLDESDITITVST